MTREQMPYSLSIRVPFDAKAVSGWQFCDRKPSYLCVKRKERHCYILGSVGVHSSDPSQNSIFRDTHRVKKSKCRIQINHLPRYLDSLTFPAPSSRRIHSICILFVPVGTRFDCVLTGWYILLRGRQTNPLHKLATPDSSLVY